MMKDHLQSISLIAMTLNRSIIITKGQSLRLLSHWHRDSEQWSGRRLVMR